MAKKKVKLNKVAIPCTGLKPNKEQGFTCYKNKVTAKVFIATHRARSKMYDSLGDIPKKVQDFISGTG